MSTLTLTRHNRSKGNQTGQPGGPIFTKILGRKGLKPQPLAGNMHLGLSIHLVLELFHELLQLAVDSSYNHSDLIDDFYESCLKCSIWIELLMFAPCLFLQLIRENNQDFE